MEPWRCAFVGTLVAAGCAGPAGMTEDDPLDGFSELEWERIAALGPMVGPPANPTNRFADDSRAAALGQRIFFERGYAGPLVVGDDGTNHGLGAAGDRGKVACASCHDPAGWFMDRRSNPNATSLGVSWTDRNAPSLVNVVYYTWLGWGGKQDSPWMQGATSHESKDNTAGNRLQYAHLLYAKYRTDYDAIFAPALDPALDPAALDASRFPPSGKPKSATTDPDGPWELMAAGDRTIVNQIISNVGKALEAYERRLVSGNAALDQYITGDRTALTASAKRGLALFIGKAGCIACHDGVALTDNDFHVTGVAQAGGAHVPATDTGRFDDVAKLLAGKFTGASAFSDDPTAGAAKLAGLAQDASQQGKFRTKNLRQVAVTGPYMHNGSLATLADVVDFYDRGGAPDGFAGTKDPRIVPLGLTTTERADLVAFLGSLTGDPVPVELQLDTSAP
jgi:cytochrome c peroxidase